MTITTEIAEALLTARRTGKRVDGTQLPSPDYDQALEVQRMVQGALGTVGGFKVARRPKGPPVIAPISQSKIRLSGADVAVLDRMGIELEIGFEALTNSNGTLSNAPQIEFLPRLVIELVDSRLTGRENDPLMKLADMQINGGLIVGPPLNAWDGSDFSTVSASLRCGDTTVVDGEVEIPGGSALSNLQLFLENVGDHCGGLKKGQIVITGSLSGLPYFPGGTDVIGKIAGFGEVRCSLI